MAGMRRVMPKMESLKETYGDDRMKLQQATMELYKKEKINPFGGCLPMLVQMPVLLRSLGLAEAWNFVMRLSDCGCRIFPCGTLALSCLC